MQYLGTYYYSTDGGAVNIEVGIDTFINTDVLFCCPQSKIKIGKRIQIGQRVSFETVNHAVSYSYGRKRKSYSKPIIVEDDVWIGIGAVILQVVKIGTDSIMMAGAIVNKDVGPNRLLEVYLQNPLKAYLINAVKAKTIS